MDNNTTTLTEFVSGYRHGVRCAKNVRYNHKLEEIEEMDSFGQPPKAYRRGFEVGFNRAFDVAKESSARRERNEESTIKES